MSEFPDANQWADLKKFFKEAVKEVPQMDEAIVAMRSEFDQLRQYWKMNDMSDAQVGALVCYAGFTNMQEMPISDEAKLMIILMSLT